MRDKRGSGSAIKNVLAIDFGTKRIYGLDILRALAILFVIAAHGAKILPQSTYRFHDYFLVDGVSLFFVLSGFLIGGILIKILEKHKATPKTLFNFWIRRWFRTIPNYFLVLAVIITLRLIFHDGFQGADVWRYFLFFQNFNVPHPEFFSEAWTLSVEEWFYLLVPAFVFMLIGIFKVAPKKAILSTALALMVASILFRLHRYSVIHPASITQWDLYFRKQVITRLDSLMFGVVGAYCAYYYKSVWIRHKNILFGGGLVLIVTYQILGIFAGSHIQNALASLYMSVFSFEIMAVGTLMLLPFLSEYKIGKGVSYKALTYISIASYSMYLIHVSLIQPLVFTVAADSTSPVVIALRYGMYWLLTIVCSIMLFKYFEKPVMDVREKFARRRRKIEPQAVPDAVGAGRTPEPVEN